MITIQGIKVEHQPLFSSSLLKKIFLFDWCLDKPFWIKPLFEISWDKMVAAGLLLGLVLC